jgi:glucose-6-phosphate 1-epimerase
MTDVHTAWALSQRYAHLLIPDVAHIEPGRGGLPHLLIEHMGAIADIYFHGAHLAQYSPPHAHPLLFLSNASQFTAGKPIRGGVPLIFPWIGPHPTSAALPAHGFVRTMEWTLSAIRKHSNRVSVELSLTDSPETHKIWPHAFELRLIVRVSTSLEMAMSVRNTGKSPFKYEEAMHTYLAVGDVRRLKIHGLAGCDYLDKVQGGRRMRQDAAATVINGETDRVYLGTRETVQVCEISGHELTVAKTGSKATVVWNPWIGKGSALSGFASDEWPHMLCIGTANAAEHAIVLAPGEHHTMTAVISAANTKHRVGVS